MNNSLTTLSPYNIKRLLLDIIYPNKCPFCEDIIPYNAYYHSECLTAFSLAPTSNVQEFSYISKLFAIFQYDDKISPLIYSLKDSGNGYAISAVAQMLCELFRKKITDTGLDLEFDLITCIPTTKARLRERGYNPPALIAKEMSAIYGIPFEPNLLQKTRHTEIQKSLSRVERLQNLEGAFCRTIGINSPKRVLLIDDVCTTGATLDEAAKVLLVSGAEKVYAAVVATTPL
ncbi:MAG: ComF family protein [Oscillospiraceae bacterium]|nr:ComF family protein [Oscillospiraceae bacterium]